MSEGRTASGVVAGDDGIVRCWWCVGDPIYQRYHDLEWGRPVADDQKIFEKLCLEGFQSGLSWLTILRKRDNFRKAFKSFDIPTVARFNARSVERLLLDAGIVRNRAKIEATIGNARATLAVRDEFGSFDSYIWRFVGGTPRRNAYRSLLDLPASTPESDAMSKDLKKRGFGFVGATICYAFMQAVGMVNDHEVTCFRYDKV